VDIVTKNKLAHKGFAPFTDYVASFWPDRPDELFAESYATWRNNPSYMKKYARPLYDWFEKGGHLVKLGLRDTVIFEIGRGVKETFWDHALKRLPEVLP
jgi:hypothetical protein